MKESTQCVESLYQTMKWDEMIPEKKKMKKYLSKPYEQMTHLRKRIQIDVIVVPRKRITDPKLQLLQYTAIDEYSCYFVLDAYPEQSTYSFTNFLKKPS